MKRTRPPCPNAPVVPWATVLVAAGISEPNRVRRGRFITELYVVRSKSGHIKIGCSSAPGFRLHTMSRERQRAHWAELGIDTSELTLLFTVKDRAGFARESALHKRFAAEQAHQRSREWFKGPQIEAFVATLLTRASEGAAA